jgi:polyisoprenoid-binding protein YceI
MPDDVTDPLSVVDWTPTRAEQFELALDRIWQKLGVIEAELTSVRQHQQTPVSGRITIRVGEEKPMTIPVHPSDTLVATVQWSNAEGGFVPGTVTTTSWSVTDAAGAPATIGTVTPDPANDESVSVPAPLALGDYILVATVVNEQSATITASSDTINVSDNNVATGVVAVTVTPQP